MEIFTIPEVCARLKISRSKLYALWANNIGPASFWIGKQRRIRQSDLTDWLNGQSA